MKTIFVLSILLLVGCSVDGQRNDNSISNQPDLVFDDGILISFKGVDFSKYEIEDEFFYLYEITLDDMFCFATEECDVNLIIELLKKGVDVNYLCEGVDHVITGLAFCKEHAVKLAEMFLSKGADINGADQDNASFLSYAISLDNFDLVEFLIKNGANPIHRDTNRNLGCLPIHKVRSIQMLKLLIENGFAIDQNCYNGRNLLHFTAMKNSAEVAEYLIENQLVEISQKDNNGETPLDYANRFNSPEVAKIIEENL